MVFVYLPLALIAIAFIIYWYITRTFNYWKKRNVASPTPVPLFGNIKESALRKKYIGSVFQDIYNQFPKEKVVGVYRMTTPCLVVRDLDILKNILVKDFHVFTDRGIEFSKKALGANLFHADGETWRVLRAKFSPIFTSGKLKNMFHIVTERADKMMGHLELTYNENPEQDVLQGARMFTMSAIAACAFGLDIDFNDPRLKVLKKLDELAIQPTFMQEVDFMFPGLLKKLNVSIFPAELTHFFVDLVQSIIRQRKGVPSDRKDFMDLILEMRGQTVHSNKTVDDSQLSLEMTDDVIAAQVAVFYVAGYETSSTTLSFMLFELAHHPEIQDKVIEEIDKMLKENNGQVTYDSLNAMTYLGKVIDETLRMYPLVDPILRRAHEDYKVPGTNIVIEKNTTVIIPVLGIHYDEHYYPNPEVFDPERFTPEQCGERHSCAFLPFGVGPRNCIGMRFARVQSRMFAIKLLSKYRVECSSSTPKKLPMDPKRNVLGSLNGVHLKLVPRSNII